MRAPEHIRLIGNQRKAAEWLPFARKLLRQLQKRLPQAPGQKTVDPKSNVRIRVLYTKQQDYIFIRVETDVEYVTIGWDDQHYLRLARTLATFPRRVPIREPAALSFEHLQRGEGTVWYTRPQQDPEVIRRAHVHHSGVPVGLPDWEVGTVANWLAGSSRQMYAALGEEPLFKFGRQALGAHFMSNHSVLELEDNEAPQFFRSFDNGETLEIIQLPRVSLPFRGTQDHVTYRWYVTAMDRDLLLSAKSALAEINPASGEYRLVVERSTNRGTDWGSSVDVVRGYQDNGLAYDTTLLWANGLERNWGVDYDVFHLISWGQLFIETVTFYKMAGDRILMVGFVAMSGADPESPEDGYWRAFISTDAGQSWSPRGVLYAPPLNANSRTVIQTPGFFRQPVVLPDNRILSIQAGGVIQMADETAANFQDIGSFPVPETDYFGVPTPAIVNGQFKVLVTAWTGTQIVVYMNTDTTYTDWEIAGVIEEMDALPATGLPVLYPFTRVLRRGDPINPAFPGAFVEAE